MLLCTLKNMNQQRRKINEIKEVRKQPIRPKESKKVMNTEHHIIAEKI